MFVRQQVGIFEFFFSRFAMCFGNLDFVHTLHSSSYPCFHASMLAPNHREWDQRCGRQEHTSCGTPTTVVGGTFYRCLSVFYKAKESMVVVHARVSFAIRPCEV